MKVVNRDSVLEFPQFLTIYNENYAKTQECYVLSGVKKSVILGKVESGEVINMQRTKTAKGRSQRNAPEKVHRERPQRSEPERARRERTQRSESKSVRKERIQRSEPERMHRERKQKKSPLAVFLHKFIVATFWLMIMIFLGTASYKLTIAYYDRTGGPKAERLLEIVNEYFEEEEVSGQVSKNLILSQNAKGEIKHIVLELFNPITGNMDYVTIPGDAQFTISNELYQRLYHAGSDAPQIMKLEDADQYFSEKVLYGYMVILLEDMLDLDINYYTVVSKKRFEEVFEKRLTEEGQALYTISLNFLNEMSHLKDTKSLENFLKKEAKTYQSNLSLHEKYKYVPEYLKMTEDCICSHVLSGTQKTDYFDVDIEEARAMLVNIEDNPIPYTDVQETMTEVLDSDSRGYQIEILNASGISGLAGFYEQKLKEDGYTIAHIGNYTLGTLTESKIFVSDLGLGKDLLNYIGKANIEITDLPDGIDIQILLGTMAEQ